MTNDVNTGNRFDGSKIAAAASYIRKQVPFSPTIALVLGSGLGDFAQNLPHAKSMSVASVPGYPHSTVEGHKGEILLSPYGSQILMTFRGRVHFYETGILNAILFPVRVAIALGAKTIILTNAAGGVNRKFQPGDLMLITDQLNLTGASAPQSGIFGRPLPDMYDRDLAQIAGEVAGSMGLTLQRGVYAGVKGPSYETAAEIDMIYRLGGDAVGMSTVIEAEAARSLGARILGISCITNKATGTSPARLAHSEVTEVANRVKEEFSALLRGILDRICLE